MPGSSKRISAKHPHWQGGHDHERAQTAIPQGGGGERGRGSPPADARPRAGQADPHRLHHVGDRALRGGRRHHPGSELHAVAGPGRRPGRPRGQGRGAPDDRVRLHRRPQRDRDRGALLREAGHRRQGGSAAAPVGLRDELRDRPGGRQVRLPDDRPHRHLREVQGAGPAVLLHDAGAARPADAGGGRHAQGRARPGQDQEGRGGLRQRSVRHRAERGHRPRLQGGRPRRGGHQELSPRRQGSLPGAQGLQGRGGRCLRGAHLPARQHPGHQPGQGGGLEPGGVLHRGGHRVPVLPRPLQGRGGRDGHRGLEPQGEVRGGQGVLRRPREEASKGAGPLGERLRVRVAADPGALRGRGRPRPAEDQGDARRHRVPDGSRPHQVRQGRERGHPGHRRAVAEERVRAGMAQGGGDRSRGGAQAGLGVTLSPTLLLDVVIGGFTTGGIYALVALGLNLQYGLMRVLNVAHGEFLMLGAYVTFSLHTGWGVNPLLTLLITGPTAFAVGLALHRLLYAPLLAGEAAESLESRSLLLSFGLMFVLQNAALLVWSADLKGYSYLAIPLRWLGTVFPANRVLAAAIALALGVAFYVYLRYSLTGKAVRALMQEPEGAQLVGIQTSRIHGLCFGAGLAMSAVTGSLVSMLFELTPFMGLPYTVTALVVVILGGLGNMVGCLMAGLLLGLVETAGVYIASSDIRLISSYAVLSLILILKPSGLFGR